MKLGTLFVINTVAAGAFGVGFALAPVAVLEPYGITGLSAGAILVARLFGGSLCGYGALTWLLRDAEDSTALRGVLSALMLTDAVGFTVGLSGQLTGAANALGWSTVAIYLLFGVGFGYFRMKMTAPAGMPGTATAAR